MIHRSQSLLDEYPKMFLVGVDNVGSKQMQQIRISLRDTAGVCVCVCVLLSSSLVFFLSFVLAFIFVTFHS